MRSFSISALIGLPLGLIFIVIQSVFSAENPSADRPNIILIFTDDQGYNDVGCYGSEIPTPNIDRLAQQGVRFENWYSASAICTPSRFGLLTGRNPSRSQDQLLSALMFMEDEDRLRGIHQHETTIAHVLQNAGYKTALIGKWHLGHGSDDFLPPSHGFDQFIGHTGGCIDYFTMTYGNIPDWHHGTEIVHENGYATELISEEAISYLRSHSKENENPFFLFLSYNAPHFGKGWEPKNQTPINIMQPQATELKKVGSIEDKVRREFGAMVVSLDDGVGRVLEAVDEYGLAENTVVIFLTDHGGDPVYGGSNLPLRGNKATLFEGGLRVPCIMRWPKKIKANSESNAVLSSLDLFPTFCAWAGVDELPAKLDGENISSLISGKDVGKSRELFWELGSHNVLDRGPWRALRSNDWKYVVMPDGNEFLFDLSKDPNEVNNIKSENAQTFSDMRERSLELSNSLRQ